MFLHFLSLYKPYGVHTHTNTQPLFLYLLCTHHWDTASSLPVVFHCLNLEEYRKYPCLFNCCGPFHTLTVSMTRGLVGFLTNEDTHLSMRRCVVKERNNSQNLSLFLRDCGDFAHRRQSSSLYWLFFTVFAKFDMFTVFFYC